MRNGLRQRVVLQELKHRRLVVEPALIGHTIRPTDVVDDCPSLRAVRRALIDDPPCDFEEPTDKPPLYVCADTSLSVLVVFQVPFSVKRL